MCDDLNKINRLFDENHYEDAFELARRMVRDKPSDSMAILWEGKTLLYLNRFQDALDCFEKGLSARLRRQGNAFTKGHSPLLVVSLG